MELTQIPIITAGDYRYSGVAVFEIGSGKMLHIKAHNEDILKVPVPDGKNWTVNIVVNIIES